MNNDKYSLKNIAVKPWCEVEDSKGKITVKIPTNTFIGFLENLDFRVGNINGVHKIVRIQDNIVTVINDNWEIVEVISKWLDDNSTGAMIGNVYKHQVKSAWINKTPQLFNRTNQGYIKTEKINRHWDSSDVCYLYFLNTALKITKDGHQCIAYADLDGHVFKEQIINREF